MNNAVMQLQIESQDDAHIEKSKNLPPEVENMFLKRIMAFEEASKNPKYITVRKLCGDLSFPASASLSETELEQMFDKVMSTLNEYNIAVDFLAEYDAKTKYNFIVNELMDHEIADIPLDDMVHDFIYEEFHPNAKMDIESEIVECMNFLCSEHEKEPELFWFADKEMYLNGEKCDGKRVIQRYNGFVAANIWPENFDYEIKSIWYDDKKKFGKAEVVLSNANEHKRTIEIKLVCTYNWWEVAELNV